MTFAKLFRDFVLSLSCLMLCGALYAASPFTVTPTELSFGEVNLGESKTQIFKVINQEATPLDVTISHPTGFLSINGSTSTVPQQLTLAPKEIKQIQVIFPGKPRCLLLTQPITVTAGSNQATVAINAKLLCADLGFVGTGLLLSLENNNIKTRFSVINTGTISSVACSGQILKNGAVAQTFDIPLFTATNPTNQKNFELLIPASPGTNTIEVRIDTNNLNREAQEDAHNVARGTITGPTPPTPPPPPPPPQVKLDVTKSGSGTGTVTDSAGMNCGADCSSTVSSGTVITLRAAPSSGSTFRSWSNGTGSATTCNNSTTAICRFTISQNSAIRADFELTQ